MEHTELQARLETAVLAARRAGEYLLGKTDFTVEHKTSNDYVTEADKHSEALIRETLLSAYPQDGFYGEEQGESKEGAGRWIVDPIDGTSNFISGLPLYTVSIAYQQEGEMLVGCVYCPPINEMYTAVRGGGAFCNGKPIRVRENTVLRDAILGMSFAHRDETDGKHMLDILPALRSGLSDMRRLGSAALDLCFVACGRYDAYIELGIHLWDFAAGMLILQEAGGEVTGWPGDTAPVEETGNVFSASRAVYPALWDLVTDAQAAFERADAVIVLGHRLNPDNTPSDDLKRRIDKTVDFVRKFNVPVIMPCGGITRDRDRSEADVMREMLLERGIPDEMIKLENQSKTTAENVINAVKLLGPDARVALISADYHIPHAMHECTQYGLNAFGVGAFTPFGEYRDRASFIEKKILQGYAEAKRLGVDEREYMHQMFRKMMEEAKARGIDPNKF